MQILNDFVSFLVRVNVHTARLQRVVLAVSFRDEYVEGLVRVEVFWKTGVLVRQFVLADAVRTQVTCQQRMICDVELVVEEEVLHSRVQFLFHHFEYVVVSLVFRCQKYDYLVETVQLWCVSLCILIEFVLVSETYQLYRELFRFKVAFQHLCDNFELNVVQKQHGQMEPFDLRHRACWLDCEGWVVSVRLACDSGADFTRWNIEGRGNQGLEHNFGLNSPLANLFVPFHTQSLSRGRCKTQGNPTKIWRVGIEHRGREENRFYDLSRLTSQGIEGGIEPELAVLFVHHRLWSHFTEVIQHPWHGLVKLQWKGI